MSALARRYAKAAVEAADHTGASAIEALSTGLDSFQAAYDASPELRELLENPGLKESRSQVFPEVLKRLKLSGEASNLLKLLAANGRISELENIAREVALLADEKNGRVRALVRSAVELTDAQARRVAGALEKRLGRSVLIEVQVEAELLGGLVCHVGDLTIDNSLRRQLERLREQFEASAA